MWPFFTDWATCAAHSRVVTSRASRSHRSLSDTSGPPQIWITLEELLLLQCRRMFLDEETVLQHVWSLQLLTDQSLSLHLKRKQSFPVKSPSPSSQDTGVSWHHHTLLQAKTWARVLENPTFLNEPVVILQSESEHDPCCSEEPQKSKKFTHFDPTASSLFFNFTLASLFFLLSNYLQIIFTTQTLAVCSRRQLAIADCG